MSYCNGVAAYSYEPDGALDSLTHAGLVGGVDVDYNLANQVVSRSVSDARFLWRPGSAGAESYAVNGLNQYTQVSPGGVPFALAYDGNGSLTGDGVWSYAYDAGNRLVSATGPGVAAAYAYDPLGRRSAKSGTGVAAEQYLSDGVEEIADYDGAGNLLRRYVHGPGIDEPVVMYTGSGTTSKQYYHADWQGSVVAMSDGAGLLVESYAYSSFGETDDPTGNPFRYTGRRIDPETGLYYYRARYYAPRLGRFLQTDPVGFADQMNLYAYVGNDPVNRKDPSGLCGSRLDGVDRCNGAPSLTLRNSKDRSFDAGKEFATARQNLVRANIQIGTARNIGDPLVEAAETVAVGSAVAIAGAVAVEAVGVAETAELAVEVAGLLGEMAKIAKGAVAGETAPPTRTATNDTAIPENIDPFRDPLAGTTQHTGDTSVEDRNFVNSRVSERPERKPRTRTQRIVVAVESLLRLLEKPK